VAVLAGCHDDIAELDGVFYDGDDRAVHCAVDLDKVAGNSTASIDTALDRAAARGEVVELYAHDPGRTVPVDTIEHVLAGATARGLGFVTYGDFARDVGTGPALALSFDDTAVVSWAALRPLFQQHGARVTFFVSRYTRLLPEERDLLRVLANDGHDVQAHSVLHLRAPEYVEDFGLDAYLEDEVLPSIHVLRDDGYEVTAYAYPFGARTGELDRAILEHVPVLRSVSFSWSHVITSPCPR
jgi:hypothetical protein